MVDYIYITMILFSVANTFQSLFVIMPVCELIENKRASDERNLRFNLLVYSEGMIILGAKNMDIHTNTLPSNSYYS